MILVEGDSPRMSVWELKPGSERGGCRLLFGKPEVKGQRRMGVALARGDTIENAKEKAIKASSSVSISLG